jgi:hypothetical protein
LLLPSGLILKVMGRRRHLIHGGLLWGSVLGRRIGRHLVKVRRDWIAIVVHRGTIHWWWVESLLLRLLLMWGELAVWGLTRIRGLPFLGLALSSVVELYWLGENVVALAFADAVGGVGLLTKS